MKSSRKGEKLRMEGRELAMVVQRSNWDRVCKRFVRTVKNMELLSVRLEDGNGTCTTNPGFIIHPFERILLSSITTVSMIRRFHTLLQ